MKILLGRNMDSGSRSASTSDMSKDLLFTANVRSIVKIDTATLYTHKLHLCNLLLINEQQ